MQFETILRLAEAVSLALTVPTVVGAFAVLKEWLPGCVRRRPPTAPTEWLILGVTISFAGGLVDNIFWGAAWSDAFFIDGTPGTFLFSIGVLFNVPFRQIAGCAAAYAHLRACCMSETPNENAAAVRRLNHRAGVSLLAGILYVVVLELL